jgi:putative transposase
MGLSHIQWKMDLKKNMAMRTIRGLFQQSPQERTITMSKTNVRKPSSQIKLFINPAMLENGFDLEILMQELQIEMQSLATSAGTALLMMFLNAEIKTMLGAVRHQGEKLYPWGAQAGYFCIGGQKVSIERPRVRRGREKGKEVIPNTYTKFQDSSERSTRVMREALARVSCRKYPEAIEKVREGYGISKSVVSRDLVRETTAELERLCARSLADFDLAVLMIDGIELDGTAFIAALGVDQAGNKRMMGFRDGATENSAVCIGLMNDLRDRGLRMERPFLAVLDGSKALTKALRDVAGELVVIQRCQIHKIRNVQSYLPKAYHGPIAVKMRAAYAMTAYDDARRALRKVLTELERINPTAARSLEEGLEETLTLHRLRAPDYLRSKLSTTNSIESSYSRSRDVMRNVKRWTNHGQKQRWMATALLQAEKSFHRLQGYRDLPKLCDALLLYQTEQQRVKSAA